MTIRHQTRRLQRLALAFSLAVPCSAYALDQPSWAERTTLEDAIALAGPSVAGLPIVLAPAPPDNASKGVEGWILAGHDGSAKQIVVYSRSDIFRCASHRDRKEYQCLLKLASIIVHEAWHYEHGSGEAGAYNAQIAFLAFHGGSSNQISGVRLARDRILGAQQAIERRRR
jgi:hypothetical protein